MNKIQILDRNMNEEYLKFLNLEEKKSHSFNDLLKFQSNKMEERRSVPYEQLKQWDRQYDPEYDIRRRKHQKVFKNWKKYKEFLEKKYKMQFPIECYYSSVGKPLFSQYFHQWLQKLNS